MRGKASAPQSTRGTWSYPTGRDGKREKLLPASFPIERGKSPSLTQTINPPAINQVRKNTLSGRIRVKKKELKSGAQILKKRNKS